MTGEMQKKRAPLAKRSRKTRQSLSGRQSETVLPADLYESILAAVLSGNTKISGLVQKKSLPVGVQAESAETLKNSRYQTPGDCPRNIQILYDYTTVKTAVVPTSRAKIYHTTTYFARKIFIFKSIQSESYISMLQADISRL